MLKFSVRPLFLGLFMTAALACAGSPKPAPDSASSETPAAASQPGAMSEEGQCGAAQFIAEGKCFDTSEAACSSLTCPYGCEVLETGPAQVRCKAQ